MFRPRVIPCLLLKHLGLVKTVKFKDPTYIGDPINAVKIFNELEADELAFLDITASKENRLIDIELVKRIGKEAFMPFAVGGGIKSIEEVKRILGSGAEKIIINTNSVNDPELVNKAAEYSGNQSVVVSIDVKKNLFGKYQMFTKSGTQKTSIDPVEHAKKMEQAGAGEILINSIDKDGTMTGYDVNLIRQIADNVTIPVIAIGGAGTFEHFREAVDEGHASAVAAGSMFVFHGPRRAVLINYPTEKELEKIFN
ncbi:MAG TPA: AglZ/HisF2 family acetamidino modification protein [Ignavibacteria bacterium]|nr:AglZ/HisF2 family acetamidino modification protein [Ignavibacteria bacterium]